MSSYATPNGLLLMGFIFPVLGIVFVILRFYSRHMQKLPFLLDDLFIIPATILMILSCVSLVIGVLGKGLGYPTPGLSNENPLLFNPSQQVLAEKVEFVIITFQPLALGFTKLSIIFFYRRVFCGTGKSFFGTITCITIALIVLWAISFFAAWLFSCGTHFDYQWGPIQNLATGQCVNTLQLNEAYAISDVLMDLVILFLPVYEIWKLCMPLASRIAVLFVLLLGALAVVPSIIRTVIVILLVKHIDSSFITTDEDLLVSTLLYWSVCESGLAILVACLPTFRLPYFFSKIDFDSMLNRLRSRFSPRSPSSKSHSYFDTLGNGSEGYGVKSTVEVKSFTGTDMETTNSNRDIEAGLQPASEYGIFVKNDIVQVEDNMAHTTTQSLV